MKAFLPLMSMLFTASVCLAQSPFQKYLQAPGEFELSCEFSYVTDGDVPVKGSGEVWVCGDSFSVKGNGLVVLCDGKTRWTVDEPAKEIYAESSDDIRDFLDNPALLLQEMSDVRETSKSITGVYYYEDQKISLKFSNLVLLPFGTIKKSFNPEGELKDYKSKGYVYNDLR